MNSFKGKKLLILAGASVHCKVVEAAKEMGVYTIVTDYLESSPAKEIADEKWMLNIMNVEEIVKRCEAEGVDGVINVCIDPGQRPYQAICEKLNLPCFGDYHQFHVLTDKTAFKDFCVKNGVDIIPTYTTADVENDNVEYPLLIKPVDSRGSRGMSVCYNMNEALKGIEFASDESSNGEVVIEKYMEGKQDFSMTYLVVDGKPNLVRIGDRYLGKREDGLNKQCIFSMSPSRYSDMYIKNVHPHVVDFIKNLGIKNGPVFMQGFVDGNTVRFYDPGLRFPGTDYEKLFYKATGIDLMKMVIEFALNGKITDKFGNPVNGYRLAGHTCAQMFVSARAGKIAAYDGIEEIAANKNIITADQRYFEGETVPPSGDVKQRVAEIVILTEEKSRVKELVEWVYDTLKVCDEDGKDMIVSKMDTEILS